MQAFLPISNFGRSMCSCLSIIIIIIIIWLIYIVPRRRKSSCAKSSLVSKISLKPIHKVMTVAVSNMEEERLNPLDAKSRYTDFAQTSLRCQKSVYRWHGISTQPPEAGIPAAWYINVTGQKPVYRICFLMHTGTGMLES